MLRSAATAKQATLKVDRVRSIHGNMVTQRDVRQQNRRVATILLAVIVALAILAVMFVILRK